MQSVANEHPHNKGKIIIISAPSGSGKTTLVKRLMQTHPNIEFSISACTRQPRDGEQHAKDYYFLPLEEFKKHIDDGDFVEWEMVYPGKYYGTLRAELQRIWDEGKTPMVDIDVQGALAVKARYPANSLSIFIEAPSIEVLRERLMKRGTETEHSLAERINKAEHELALADRFDAIIINDDLDTATLGLMNTVDAFLGSGQPHGSFA